eukprot:891008-Pelagomonas_calceolata.AAC.3
MAALMQRACTERVAALTQRTYACTHAGIHAEDAWLHSINAAVRLPSLNTTLLEDCIEPDGIWALQTSLRLSGCVLEALNVLDVDVRTNTVSQGIIRAATGSSLCASRGCLRLRDEAAGNLIVTMAAHPSLEVSVGYCGVKCVAVWEVIMLKEGWVIRGIGR